MWIRKALILCCLLLCMAVPVSAQTFESADEIIAYIDQHHPESMDIRSCSLTFEEVRTLLETCPQIEWRYCIELAGVSVDSEAEVVDLNANGRVRPDVQQLHERLALLPNLRQLDMYEEKLTSEEMGLLFDAYPSISFGWMIRVGRWSLRTDITAFSTLNPDPPSGRWKSQNFADLRFCRHLRALDLGHNAVSDLSFLESLIELRVLILADNRITDISPLRNLKELQYVELFMNKITDLSPLEGHPNLLDLNLTWNRISDHTPLLSCKRLERLWCGKNSMTEEGFAELRAAFPNATLEFYSSGSTGYGWREHERYQVIKKIFNNKGRTYYPFPNNPVITETTGD